MAKSAISSRADAAHASAVLWFGGSRLCRRSTAALRLVLRAVQNFELGQQVSTGPIDTFVQLWLTGLVFTAAAHGGAQTFGLNGRWRGG